MRGSLLCLVAVNLVSPHLASTPPSHEGLDKGAALNALDNGLDKATVDDLKGILKAVRDKLDKVGDVGIKVAALGDQVKELASKASTVTPSKVKALMKEHDEAMLDKVENAGAVLNAIDNGDSLSLDDLEVETAKSEIAVGSEAEMFLASAVHQENLQHRPHPADLERGQAVRDKPFYLFTFEEVEERFPELKKCGITLYGLNVYRDLLVHERRTKDIKEAGAVVMAPYLAQEFNWPTYNRVYRQDNNMGRKGTPRCGGSVDSTLVVDRARELWAWHGLSLERNEMVMIQNNPYYAIKGDPYSDPMFTWVMTNHVDKKFRRHKDISLPPPYNDRPSHYRFDPADTSPKGKKYFATFMGRLTHGTRKRLHEMHDPEKGILMLDAEKDNAKNQWDYEELMANARFAIVPRGMQEFSYRYTEAVCSGAVPVLLADGWVVPLEELKPFEEYGVRLRERDVWDPKLKESRLIRKLREIPDEVVERKRAAAETFCHRHLSSIQQQVDAVVSLLCDSPGSKAKSQQLDGSKAESQQLDVSKAKSQQLDGGATAKNLEKEGEADDALLDSI